MASKLPTTLCTISPLLIFFFSSPSLANLLTSIFNTPATICSYSRFPYFCRSSLPYNKPGTIQDYAKISLQNSLSHAQQFLGLVQHYSRGPSTMYRSTIVALEDCVFLTQENIEFMAYVLESLKSSNDALQGYQVDDLQTLLSAILTNQETCLDGMKYITPVSSIKNVLLAPIWNGTMHYSVALALFMHGWGHGRKESRYLTERKHVFSNMDDGDKGLPLVMSSKDKEIYELVSGRRLLKASSYGGILVSKVVVVDPYASGGGKFRTITDAVAAAPKKTIASDGYYVIYVVAGVYNEYVSIPKNKNYLMMIGAGINRTVMTGDRSVADGWTTFNSATFVVVGKGFVAVNITFRNTAGAIKSQAVAVRNGADMSTFYKCSFEGYQDTLYTHSLRQFYRDCDIHGTVDYIFGNAAVVFQNCSIYSRLPLKGQSNTITAQGRTDPNQNTGTSIQNCTILAADDLASSNSTTKTYLGRPWREYSRTVVMQSFIDALIDPAGWAAWSGDFALSTLYYAEFNNAGPGSNTTNRVTWPGYHVINETDAANFTITNFIQGDFWLPATGIPYFGGLHY